MTWLVWRQYRAQGAIASALLAAFAAVILADGFQIASHWHSMLATCAGTQRVPAAAAAAGQRAVSDLLLLSLIVPVVLGMLWGAPLVAHELEARTSDFAWAQSVTRTRWLTAKAGWLLLAAAACGGAIAALITWWSGPNNALTAERLPARPVRHPGHRPRRLRSVRHGARHRRGHRDAPDPPRDSHHARRVHRAAPGDLRFPPAALHGGGHDLLQRSSYNTGSFTPPGRPGCSAQGAVSTTGKVVPRGWGTLGEGALPASCQKMLTAGPREQVRPDERHVLLHASSRLARVSPPISPPAATGHSRASRQGSTSCWPRP